MVKFVDQQLTQLRNEVYRMWAMVYSQMDQARQAVLGMDRNIAQQIWVRERLRYGCASAWWMPRTSR